MSPERKGRDGKLLVGGRMLLETSIVAVLVGAILITLGWQSGHVDQASLPATTTSAPPSTSPSTTTAPPMVVVSGRTMGSPTAPLTIVEYSDFQCHGCQRFAKTIEPQLEAAYVQTGKVRLVYKYMVVFGSGSVLASEAAESAAEQNEFWPYYSALMNLSLSSNTVTVEQLQDVARQLGLNMDAFNEAFLSEKYEDTVLRDDAEGKALGISAIPAFFVNGVKADSSILESFDDFSKALDEALAKLGQ